MSNFIFVLDTNRKPLNPCRPITCRKLLKAGKAKVFKRYPFTIILNKEVTETPKPVQLKLDPGSLITGIALVQENREVIFAAELIHRGKQIKDSLLSRRQLRRSRRSRKTRYRPARFLNRTRVQGWLAPSLKHRVETTLTWVTKLRKLAPINKLTQELARFDLQLLQNPEISGVEYQQGELQGYEVREYLLEKFNRQCAYCKAKDIALEIEHIQARSRGGSDRVSNLTLACRPCNQAKGNQDIKDFLSGKPDVLKRVVSQAKSPLKVRNALPGKLLSSTQENLADAAAINSTRWTLFNRLKETKLEVTTGSGGKTKFNRIRLGLQKTHWLDAACVGDVPELKIKVCKPLLIKATGHGTRQMCRTDRYGFPSRYVPRFKLVKGYQTGDIVKAIVPLGKKVGNYVGRVAVRSTGSFNISTKDSLVQGISHKYCQPIHKKDGYSYAA